MAWVVCRPKVGSAQCTVTTSSSADTIRGTARRHLFFLPSLFPQPFNFGYRYVWLYICKLTWKAVSRNIADSFWYTPYILVHWHRRKRNYKTRFVLGVFANCEKRLLASSCLSGRMEQLGPHLTDFHEIWYSSVFRKPVEKIHVSLKSDKNNGYFTWRRLYIYNSISLNSS
jgi:hypothetical protein